MEYRNNKLVKTELSKDNMVGIWNQRKKKRKKKRRKPYVTQTDGLKTLEESMSISVLDNLFIPVDKLINFQLSNHQ